MPKISIEIEADNYEALARLAGQAGKSLSGLLGAAATYGDNAEAAILTHMQYIADMHDLDPEPHGKIKLTRKADD